MARSSQRRSTGARGRSGSAAQQRQRAVSEQIAGAARRSSPGAARRAAGKPVPSRTQVLARPRKGAPPRIRPTAMLLRFISCGLVSLAAGLSWFLTHRDQKVTPTGALFGALLLLSGFLVGGVFWYFVDARRRLRDRRRVDDEQIVFSFVVFVLVPLAVLLLLLLVWVITLVAHV